MLEDHIGLITHELNIKQIQVANTIKLLNEGATIPFISRYRKEVTGSLDETIITAIHERFEKLKDLDKRREAILKSIDEQGQLTPFLQEQIESATSMNDLEDLYLPYKPKRKTRASIAKEKGLEPLARIVMQQKELNLDSRAGEYITDQVATLDEALQGARDIIAEWINENKRARNTIRNLFQKKALISSKVSKRKEEEGIKYKDYFEFSEPLKKCASHRYLAMRRGEEEGFLKISVAPEGEEAIMLLEDQFVKGYYDVSEQVRISVKDSYKRLLAPSLETEFKSITKERADEEAIHVFAENLRQLLLAPPLGQKNVLAIDPGFRTGCKVVVLDRQGNLIHNETIYPHPPQQDTKLSAKKITSLVETYKIEAIAIGNGTAGRETEAFIGRLKFNRELLVFVVSESGASVYSASSVAREEFPEYDVTVRGAVSIGRRLMDPLAELVKIDPKSIGVGQYQHDVDQTKLKNSLTQVVESCVNKVGVNVNTASKHILTYVSGLGPTLAQNIVDYRRENGDFTSRDKLKKVPRMGDKAFEQCAGFLRINNPQNPLDNSAVHPESYHVVEQMAKDLNIPVYELLKNDALRNKIDIQKYVTPTTGLPTLKDIIQELAKPGRDPRSTIKVFTFDPNIRKVEDVKAGMELPGIVTNITNFGAFVDIGVKQDGLVHVSQLANRFVSDPNEVVKLHQHVKVKVLDVDIARKRIQLSMKELKNN
ncbi:MAG TPA: Tex family protein [Bacteroidales bacterium]|nr:Tex family protein [Bacteroidales bacterium]